MPQLLRSLLALALGLAVAGCGRAPSPATYVPTQDLGRKPWAGASAKPNLVVQPMPPGHDPAGPDVAKPRGDG